MDRQDFALEKSSRVSKKRVLAPVWTENFNKPLRDPEILVPKRKESGDWLRDLNMRPRQLLSVDEKFSEQIKLATSILSECIEINIKKLGGVPVIMGTRFSVAQLLSQIADGDSLNDVAENFELDNIKLQSLLHAMAAFLDRPIYK